MTGFSPGWEMECGVTGPQMVSAQGLRPVTDGCSPWQWLRNPDTGLEQKWPWEVSTEEGKSYSDEPPLTFTVTDSGSAGDTAVLPEESGCSGEAALLRPLCLARLPVPRGLRAGMSRQLVYQTHLQGQGPSIICTVSNLCYQAEQAFWG